MGCRVLTDAVACRRVGGDEQHPHPRITSDTVREIDSQSYRRTQSSTASVSRTMAAQDRGRERGRSGSHSWPACDRPRRGVGRGCPVPRSSRPGSPQASASSTAMPNPSRVGREREHAAPLISAYTSSFGLRRHAGTRRVVQPSRRHSRGDRPPGPIADDRARDGSLRAQQRQGLEQHVDPLVLEQACRRQTMSARKRDAVRAIAVEVDAVRREVTPPTPHRGRAAAPRSPADAATISSGSMQSRAAREGADPARAAEVRAPVRRPQYSCQVTTSRLRRNERDEPVAGLDCRYGMWSASSTSKAPDGEPEARGGEDDRSA